LNYHSNEVAMFDAFEKFDGIADLDRAYRLAIDGSAEVTDLVYKRAAMFAEAGKETIPSIIGGLGRFWNSPTVEKLGLQGRPSSLGQMLVLGSLGALAGHGIGRVVDHFSPTDAFKASRVGALLGAVVGATPGAIGAAANAAGGRPALASNFYATDFGAKEASFNYSQVGYPSGINVNNAQQAVWSSSHIPIELKAYTSGLLNAAATLPDRRSQVSAIITPMDIARVAVGLGSGVASANLVGNAMGYLFGTGEKTKQMLQNTGAALGVLRSIVPVAYGREPFSLG
jgi:hypothetical protein